MTLHHPIQKLSGVVQGTNYRFLLAASGPTISTISLPDQAILYCWPSSANNSDGDDDDVGEDDDRPNKRRKTMNGRDTISRQQSEASDASIEIVAERKKGERKKTKIIDTKSPNVSHIMVTTDGKYAIAVTVDDKAVRVFGISPKGKLTQHSTRSLPKKICALRLTKDERTILTADKFGDVYAVPLHQSENWVQKHRSEEATLYKPSATELTVHTKGNLEALRQQQEQKRLAKKKEDLGFEHHLLLGHVSLLTDLAVGESIVNGWQRSFILSSDRDEHIRVSRGIPQAHVIESFCLGHTDFVSKLCIPPSRPELLVAGNGEASLKVFEWRTGRLLQTSPIGNEVLCSSHPKINEETLVLPEGRVHTKLAVSGIWPMTVASSLNSGSREGSLILVAIEGLPLLLTYTLSSSGLSFVGSTELRGNILDIFVLDAEQRLIVSVDNVHRPYSMKLYREQESQQDGSLQLLELQPSQDQPADAKSVHWITINLPVDTSEITHTLPLAPELLADESTKTKPYEKPFSSLGEFLYGLENLRKKRDYTAEEEEAADMEAEEVEAEMKAEIDTEEL